MPFAEPATGNNASTERKSFRAPILSYYPGKITATASRLSFAVALDCPAGNCNRFGVVCGPRVRVHEAQGGAKFL